MNRDRGISLIELVVAMSLFAVVALMGVQAITGQLGARDRMLQTDRRTAELALALSLLRADLSAIVPVGFRSPDGVLQSVVTVDDRGRDVEIALSLGGQASLKDPRAIGFQRALWRWNKASGELHRSFWPSLTPPARSTAEAELLVLSGVRQMEFRLFFRNQNWQTLYPKPERQGVTGGLMLTTPSAAALSLETETFGTLNILQALD